MRAAIRQQREHLYYRFEEKAKATPDRIFLYFEDKTYTFRQVEQGNIMQVQTLLCKVLTRLLHTSASLLV